MTNWKEKESKNEYWRPENIGDELVGEVLEIIQSDFGKQYKIRCEDGREVITPSHKVLQDRLEGVERGTKVKIVLDSELPPKQRGHNATKIYKVFLAEE